MFRTALKHSVAAIPPEDLALHVQCSQKPLISIELVSSRDFIVLAIRISTAVFRTPAALQA